MFNFDDDELFGPFNENDDFIKMTKQQSSAVKPGKKKKKKDDKAKVDFPKWFENELKTVYLISQKQELYDITLQGHLIKLLRNNNGRMMLKDMVQATERVLPYLRRCNGKPYERKKNLMLVVRGVLHENKSFYLSERENEVWSINVRTNHFIIHL